MAVSSLFEPSDNNPLSGKVVRETINELLRAAAGLPSLWGATGDPSSTDDDTTAILAASAACGKVVVPAGHTYRIKALSGSTPTNPRVVSIGYVEKGGGFLEAEANVVVLYRQTTGDESTPVFKGAGIFKSRPSIYNIADYDGQWGNNRYDFARRGMPVSPRKIITFPVPDETNSSYVQETNNRSPMWGCDAEIVFGDPENNATIHMKAGLKGVKYGMECLIRFSDIGHKTEDQRFPLGIHLDGGRCAMYGGVYHGGARTQFFGTCRITHVIRSPWDGRSDLWPTDVFYFQRLHVSEYGQTPVIFAGSAQNATGINCLNVGSRIDHLEDNGAHGLYGTATVSNGGITSIALDSGQEFGGFEVGSTYQVRGVYKSTGGVSVQSGYGAEATATVNAQTGVLNPASLVIKTAGTGFVNGDRVFLTTARSYVQFLGWTVGCAIGRVTGVVNAPQVPIFGPEIELMGNAAGCSRKAHIGPVDHEVRDRQKFNAASNAVTAFRHQFILEGVVAAYKAQNPNDYHYNVAYTTDSTIYGVGRTSEFNGAIINVDTSTTRSLTFLGVPYERVRGSHPTFTFDGKLIFGGNGTAGSGYSFSILPFTGANYRRTIALISDDDNVDGLFAAKGLSKLAPISSLTPDVEIINGVALDGTQGTSGKFQLGLLNGTLYLYNRKTSGGVPHKIVVDL